MISTTSDTIKGLEWMSLLSWARCCYPWHQHKQEFSLVWIQAAEACLTLQQPKFEPWKAQASFQSFTLRWEHLTSALNPKLNLPLVFSGQEGQFAKRSELLGSHQSKVQGRSAHSSATDPSLVHLLVVTRGAAHQLCWAQNSHGFSLGQLLMLKVRRGWRRMHRDSYRSLWLSRKGGTEMCCCNRNAMKTLISALGAGEIIQFFNIMLQISLLSCTLMFLWDCLKEIKVMHQRCLGFDKNQSLFHQYPLTMQLGTIH